MISTPLTKVLSCPLTENIPHTSSSSGRRHTLAFTLVELLVVMGIVSILITMTVLGFNNLLGSRGMEGSIYSVTSFLEMSRVSAISNRTLVFCLFKNVINSDNSCELKCVAMRSVSGMNAWNAENLRPISKVIRIPGVKNVKYTQMPSNVQAVTPSELQSDGSFFVSWYPGETTTFGSGTNSKPVIVDGENFTNSLFIGFLRNGEIGTSSGPGKQDPYALMVEPKISLGLIATRGTNIQSNSKDAAIVTFYGANGKIRVIRP